MVPDSAQSADSEAKGLHITQAGPDLVKKFAYLDAEIARRWDRQMAAIYYDQVINKGKHRKRVFSSHDMVTASRVWLPLGQYRLGRPAGQRK